ncbi:helix-turn-helix domain-containing protein [Chryseobacterium indologenes]|uniref:helix-turn-helix domain-containing protein n=1 Tax=Chryseobacterium indologenes TaxID=253 RepID=UPI001627DE46|nr:helix-turn-helix domain-containing protein [Chryseobacterium indologenes]
MKNPKSNPSIEAIKARMRKEIGYLPSDNIPNSYISKKLEKLDANATLEYAKLLNRPVRKAKDGECEHSRSPLKPQYVKVDANKPKGMLSTEEAAEKIGVKTSVIRYFNKCKNVDSVKIGQRIYFPESSIAQLASFARTSA